MARMDDLIKARYLAQAMVAAMARLEAYTAVPPPAGTDIVKNTQRDIDDALRAVASHRGYRLEVEEESDVQA